MASAAICSRSGLSVCLGSHGMAGLKSCPSSKSADSPYYIEDTSTLTMASGLSGSRGGVPQRPLTSVVVRENV